MRGSVLIIFLLSVFVQVTILDALQISGIKPDFVFILVIFYAFLKGEQQGAIWGFLAGLLKDVVAGSYFGLNALDHMVAGYLAGVVQNALYRDNPFVVSLVVLFGYFATGLMHYLLLLFLGIFISPWVAIFKISFCGAVYNAIFALFFYKWFFRAYSRVY